MTIVLALDDLRRSPTAALFEGHRHAEGVDVSCFVTKYPHGGGPQLHKHPYAEVFVVQDGEATFTAGADELLVTGGHIVVVPPETPHRFENTGHSPLRVVSIHPSGEVRQTDLAR
jgi:mannose-6-phosphate isomerase-like protein (cupin superfamily)